MQLLLQTQAHTSVGTVKENCVYSRGGWIWSLTGHLLPALFLVPLWFLSVRDRVLLLSGLLLLFADNPVLNSNQSCLRFKTNPNKVHGEEKRLPRKRSENCLHLLDFYLEEPSSV